MSVVNPTIQNSLVVNDETLDDSGQLAPGDEAVDGDGNPVITAVRLARAPLGTDIRPQGQLWLNTSSGALYWSGGGGVWLQVRDTASLPPHEATHLPDGADAIPWLSVHGSGLFASRPAASAANAGFLYDAQDVQRIYLSTGTVWVEISISASTHEFVFTQGAPATGWVVNHNLGRFPSAVQVRDTGGTVFLAPIQHNSVNQLTVTFGRPTAGTCTLR